MATVDFTLEDLRGIFATKEDLKSLATKEDLKGLATKEDLNALATKEELSLEISGVKREIRRVASMPEEDALAESSRLDRVERRSLKTQKILLEHIADKELHRQDG